MKVCQNCGEEIGTRDGENLCRACDDCDLDKAQLRRRRAATSAKLRDAICRDMGLVKVRGAMGGTYWE